MAKRKRPLDGGVKYEKITCETTDATSNRFMDFNQFLSILFSRMTFVLYYATTNTARCDVKFDRKTRIYYSTLFHVKVARSLFS